MPAAAVIIGGISALQISKQAKAQNEFAQENLIIQTQNSYIQGQNTIRDYNKTIADLKSSQIQYGINIRDATSQVQSYDSWLKNYGKQYAQEVQSKQAQTDSLMASGRETYENFLNAIGYADAMAGATGRVGAGTSQAATTGMLDNKLVDYVGEDRTLDANGGLFGSQLTAANMEMEQLKVDLEFQRQEMVANRDLLQATIGDWQQAINLTDESITNSEAARDSLQQFIDKNFSTDEEEGIRNPHADRYDQVVEYLDPLGLLPRGKDFVDKNGRINPSKIFEGIFKPFS